jgi:non-ribosomal peptide synthetase component E (peptide arylation enzyme)
MILRGGQNIFPQEIEDLLGSHPKVAKVCIVPMPDARLGEKACAYVISREGEKFTLEDMIAYLEEKTIARYKFPERLEIVGEFPMVSGKEDKRALVSDVCNKLLKEGKLSKELVDDFAEKGKLRPELLSF